MLHGEPEHDEGERRLGHAVVLAQVVLHSLRQQRRVRDLVVYFYIHLNIIIFYMFKTLLLARQCHYLRVHVVTEKQHSEMLIIDHGAAAEHVREEDLAQINFEKPLTLGFDHREICLAVLVIYQTVIEHSVDLKENIFKI